MDNFNYFDVGMRNIEVDVIYPINNTPIGGGSATDVFFKSGTETNFTFPFALTYDPSSDTSGQVLADIATKCGVGGQRSDISVNYKLTVSSDVACYADGLMFSHISLEFGFCCSRCHQWYQTFSPLHVPLNPQTYLYVNLILNLPV